VPSGSYQQLD